MPILLVTIDEMDLFRLGHWPIDDGTLAQVLNQLKRYQPAAIGLDLYRNLPVAPGGAAGHSRLDQWPALFDPKDLLDGGSSELGTHHR